MNGGGGVANANSGGGQMVICPMCGGTGVFEFIPGDAFAPKETCSACNGTGQCTAQTAQKVYEAQQVVNQQFGGGGSSGGYSGGGSSNVDRNQCVNCYGSGKCPMCAGRGERRYEGMYGQPGGIMDCPTCHGGGRCQFCGGSGRR